MLIGKMSGGLKIMSKYMDRTLSPEVRAEALLNEMSLEEDGTSSMLLPKRIIKV